MKQPIQISPFCGYTAFLIIGILAQKNAPQSLLFWVILMGFSLLLGCLVQATKQTGWMLFFSCAIIAFGGVLMAIKQDEHKQNELGWAKASHSRWSRDKIIIKAHLKKRISFSEQKMTFHAQVFAWKDLSKKMWVPINETIRLSIKKQKPKQNQVRSNLLKSLRVGDTLQLQARLYQPQWFANPGIYNWKSILEQKGIRWLASSQESETARIIYPHKSTNDIIDKHRHQIYEWIHKQAGNSQVGAVIQSLVLGEKTGINKQTRRQFMLTGTSHLLAISGLHLAIVSHLCFLFFSFLFRINKRLKRSGQHRKWGLFAAIPCVFGYTCLSGASPSTQRAALMLLLFSVGFLFDRKTTAWNTLALTAWILLILDPTMLLSLSFQLSFLAVIVLLISQERTRTQNESRIKNSINILKNILKASMWVTLGTLPLILSFSKTVPIWSPLINLIAVPLGGYFVVGTSLFATGLWYLWEPAGSWVLHVAIWFAEKMLQWIAITSQLPHPIECPPLYMLEIIAFYAALGALMIWKKGTNKQFYLLMIAATCITASWIKRSDIWKEKTLKVHFLDIGQGDATWIEFPNGQTMMIDAGGGGFGSFDIGQKILLPYFRWKRKKRIDFAVLTHPHPDHYEGFHALFSTLSIGQFWYTGQQEGLSGYKHLLQLVKKKRIPTRLFHKPETINIGKVQIRICHPFPQKNEGKTYYWGLHANDNSLVMLLTYKRVTLLFTGDIEKRGEEILIKKHPHLHADILKVPHHGSRTSSSQLFLSQIKPRYAIASLGRNNRYGFPHRDVIRRYKQNKIKLLRTDQKGRIQLTTDGKEWTFQTFRKVVVHRKKK